MKTLYTRPDSSEKMENNLIPMINIIFLLLIFFMMVGHISSQAKPAGLALAKANSQVKIKPSNVTLSLTKDGEYYKDGVLTTLAEVKAFFKENKQLTEVNLQSDKQVTTGDLDELLDILRAANVSSVAITVTKEEP